MSSGVPGAARATETVRYDLDMRSVLVLITCLVSLYTVLSTVRAAPRAMTALVIGSMFALALNPVVEFLMARTRMRRPLAVATVFAISFLVFAAVAVLLIPPAVGQVEGLGRQLPKSIAELGQLPVVGPALERADIPARITAAVENLPERLREDLSPLGTALRSVVSGFFAGGIVLLIAICLLVDGGRLVEHARRLVPAERRGVTDRLGALAYRAIGRYVAGSLLVATIAGIYTLSVGLILGIPLTPLLAVNVMLFDLVPQIGGAAGGFPFVIMAFSKSPTTGLIAAVLFLLYLQLENNVLQPIVIGQAVKLSPVATMAAALIGVAAGGVVGALIAVPFVGAAKLIYLELFPHGIDAGTTGPRRRRRLHFPHRT
jgi:predicted PurR-regulated permease PerM